MAIYDIRAPGARRPLEYVELGPGVGADVDRRLLGDIEGRNVLVLGCGAGHGAVGLAKRGARVTAVDRSAEQLASGREMAEAEEVVTAFRQAELADLAFIQADQMDIAVSVHALSFVHDLDRVFRQVHRVLKQGAHFVISVPHAATLCSDPVDPRRTTRRWDEPGPLGDAGGSTGPRTCSPPCTEPTSRSTSSSSFTLPARARHVGKDTVARVWRDHGLKPWKVDTLPATLVVRGEKLGT